MAIDIAGIAGIAVKALAPFLPFLVEIGKSGAKKLTEVIAERGGEAAWSRAQSIWNKLTDRLGDDIELKSTATLLAIRPEDEERQAQLAILLGKNLEANPELARELLALVGGTKGVMEVLAGEEAWIVRVRQKMYSSGTMRVQGGKGSFISDIDQEMG